jgi:hypothetical protein
MSASFVKPWTRLVPPGEPGHPLLPTLDVLVVAADGRSQREVFVVDSGADISLAPRHLCDELGLPYDAASLIQLQGISPKPECAVPGRILEVELIVPDAGLGVTVPVCFAERSRGGSGWGTLATFRPRKDTKRQPKQPDSRANGRQPLPQERPVGAGCPHGWPAVAKATLRRPPTHSLQ